MNIRLYVGRSINATSDNTTCIGELETQQVVDAALAILPIDALTAYEAVGYWRGGQENTVVIDLCGVDNVAEIEQAVPVLARALRQTSIYYTDASGAACELAAV